MKTEMKSLAREITTILTIFIVASYFINLIECRTVFVSNNRRHDGDKTANTPRVPVRAISNTADKTRNIIDFDTEDAHYANVPISLAAARTGKASRNSSTPAGEIQPRPAHSGQISAIVQAGRVNHARVSELGSECGRQKACAIRETSRAMRVETLKRTILEKLKMSAPPNVTRPNLNSSSIQEWLKRYNIRPDQGMGNDDGMDDFDDDDITIKRIMKIAKPPKYQPPNRKTNCCAFNFTENELQYAVKDAHLMIYVRPLPAHLNVTHRTSLVMIRRYLRPDTRAGPFQRIKLLRVNQTAKGHWRQVKLSIVSLWFLNPKENLGLDIISINNPGVIMTTADYVPLLDVALTTRTRQKRNAGLRCDAEHDQEETRCCMYDFTINFEQIGWDWIVFPPTYNARYCSGECAFLQLTSMRSKLIRQSDFTRQNKTSNCCVPKKMAAISLLYFDESETIIYSSVPEMKIKRCGCM